MNNEEIKLTENAEKILKARYYHTKSNGAIETWEGLCWRVARSVAAAEKTTPLREEWTEKFYHMIYNQEMLPNSPTLMNCGKEVQMLSACFVLPIEDSIEGIFDAMKWGAMVHMRGGGTGYAFSKLRGKGALVNSSKGQASGPISFMTAFDAATATIAQGGTRRGANMAVLDVHHPDILDFIRCKTETDKLNNFNISVAVTDKFITAIRNGDELENEIFDAIVYQSWLNAEPGILFIDTINAANPTPHVGKYEACNPCGEQMLLPMESCNLGSINLTKFILDGSFDWNKLRTCVETSIRFLDNVIDVSDHPLPEIKEMTEANRKCGLGVMGFADALIELEVVYGSKDSLTLAENVMSFIDTNAYKYSIDLAEEKGEYPNYVYSDFTPVPTRNACRTSIQPTGTVSIIANCSSGIEPIFALKLTRNSFDGAFDDEYYQPFYDFMKNLRLDDSYISKIAEEGVMKNPTKTNCPQFITAHEISPESHVRMLATFQENVDSGISKTINMPNDASEEDVRQAILLAYGLKCKGVSVYRDGSRVQVLENASKSVVPTTIDTPILTFTRPRTLNGKTTKILTGCGALYVTISYDDNGMPQEVFSHLGKGGACSHSSCEAIGRLSSVILQNDIGVPAIVKQLQGIRCPIPRMQEGGTVLSCADAIGKVLAELITDVNTIYSISANDETGHTQFCPECGNGMVFNQGCAHCSNCGHSKCG